MGYTHYWTFLEDGNEKEYKKALEQCYKIVLGYNAACKLEDWKHPGRLSGHTAHAPTGKYKDIEVNGTKENAHETFFLSGNLEVKGDFCKTARKPYDAVVVACLIVLKHYLKSSFQVESDGEIEDWALGLGLAESITGLKLSIPKTIERRSA